MVVILLPSGKLKILKGTLPTHYTKTNLSFLLMFKLKGQISQSNKKIGKFKLKYQSWRGEHMSMSLGVENSLFNTRKKFQKLRKHGAVIN